MGHEIKINAIKVFTEELLLFRLKPKTKEISYDLTVHVLKTKKKKQIQL